MKRATRLKAYIRSGLVTVKYIILPTICLYAVESIFNPLASLVSLHLGTIGFFTTEQFCKLNLSRIVFAFILGQIKIQLEVCMTSMPRKYLMHPKLVILNLLFIEFLNCSSIFPLFLVKLISSTYKFIIRISTPPSFFVNKV